MDTTILGIDLAWGLKASDAIARLDWRGDSLEIGSLSYTHGEEPLTRYVTEISEASPLKVLLAIDAPLQCLNETGSRPVDKQCSALYRTFEAGCHPVNLTLCPRPIALGGILKDLGFTLGWDVSHQKLAMEVYPHPAMIHWFQLGRTIKYKRGKVAEKKEAFAFYQSCFKDWLAEHYPTTPIHEDLRRLLEECWSKKNEDGLDAYFCAFIGLWHAQYAGERSQVLGDEVSGFMVIPRLSKEEIHRD